MYELTGDRFRHFPKVGLPRQLAQIEMLLLVARGSRQYGRIAENDIMLLVESSDIVACLAEAGNIWADSTPIRHASETSCRPCRRRVPKVDYAAMDLPGGLQWLGIQ
jgi:hypothetical protein